MSASEYETYDGEWAGSLRRKPRECPLTITVTPELVLVEGCEVARPRRISVSQWLDFWLHVQGVPRA